MAEDIADTTFELPNVIWTANVLDTLPFVKTFFGLDLNTAAYVIASLCIVQPVFYGCTVILPLSYLLMSIWVLVALFSVISLILLAGIAQSIPLLMTIWIWYALFFVVIMSLLMLLMSCVFCSRGQWTRLIIVLFYLLWYSFTVYCILAINGLRYNTENNLEMSDKVVDKEVVVAEMPRMTYMPGYDIWNWSHTDILIENPPDIYARPMPLGSNTIELGMPMQDVIDRRYGFILRRSETFGLHSYFGLPFTPEAWHCLYFIILIIAIIMYFLSVWEQKLLGVNQEYSFTHELLVVLGAICQHIPPVNPLSISRRLAYFTFFAFCYILYSFYTSNLLSHLVNDRENSMDLIELIRSSYKFISHNESAKGNLLMITAKSKHANCCYTEMMEEKISSMVAMNVSSALKTMAKKQVALFTDYTTVYPYIKTELDDKTICELIEVNYVDKLKEYIFVSYKFPLKEEFKVGMLRIIETGVLRRLKRLDIYSRPSCNYVPEPQANVKMITVPLAVLGTTIFLSIVIVLIERFYYSRNIIRPFIN